MPRPPEPPPSSGAAAIVPLLEHVHGALPARDILAVAVRDFFAGRIALVSSFGADSAVLLHLLAEIDCHVPVLFIDTGRHFPETLAYRDRLVEALGLTDVRSVGPTAEEIARRDPDGQRASFDPDGCCAFRKTAPLAEALRPFDAWITGRKRFQSGTRAALSAFEAEGDKVKVNPLATWSAADLSAYAHRYRLPPHPLAARGYASIGCAPCTTPVSASEDARAGRWRATGKTECGIHLPRDSNLEPRTVS